MTRPLDHITVVSLEHAIAAPLCTRHLADLGARVIKVERPGSGDFARDYDRRARGLASHFVWVNRSKESLALDLKQPEALAALKALIDRADVVVQNLAPGATTRMGLDAATWRAQNPRLIVCDISGYGQDGPYRDKKAYDLLIQSEAGMLSITGTPEDPSKTGNSIADIAASAPLLPALVPERSMACSMLSVVRTPKMTGTPLSAPAAASPLVQAPATWSKCGVEPRMTAPSAMTAS